MSHRGKRRLALVSLVVVALACAAIPLAALLGGGAGPQDAGEEAPAADLGKFLRGSALGMDRAQFTGCPLVQVFASPQDADYAAITKVLGDPSVTALMADFAGVLIDPSEKAEAEVEAQRREGNISYGLSSYGYDMRVSDEFRIFHNALAPVVDPKHFDQSSFVDISGDVCIIPPNSFALARTVEYFRIPRDVLTVCLGKSTYARCGIIVNVTPLEPEWEGHVTLEFSNTTPLPARIYANEGVAQMLFLGADEVCEASYADREGKYQGQTGVTLPKT